MIKRFLTPDALFERWVVVIRILIGIIMAKHGSEMFDAENMKGNIAFLTDVGLPLPEFMAHLAKSSELAGGICLSLGLLTRLVCIPMTITMSVVVFIYLDGTIFGDAQLPFLLMLFCLIFFIYGGGKISLDYLLYTRTTQE
jgi:uncharacterized membrane protein YphA (DoxX/SURF4 family)